MDHIRISSVEEAKVVDDKKVDLLEMTKSGFSAFECSLQADGSRYFEL